MKKTKHGNRASLPFMIRGLPAILGQADVLLIVPPFHVLDSPCLAVHLLQACGHEAGFRVEVLYANILLALQIGVEAYAKICDAPVGSFAGERFFARCAYGLPPLGRRASQMFAPDWVVGPRSDWEIRQDLDCYDFTKPVTLRELRRLERYAEGYISEVARAVSDRRYKVVGCTSIFEQTAASLALLNRIKALRKDTVTILGGANCAGEMAPGIASLSSVVDYLFSGESEATFPRFVKAILTGRRPRSRIIFGEPCQDMDSLPTPTFTEFYRQRRLLFPVTDKAAGETQIPYETSRGCWWGEKHRCTFCGLNGETAAFRQKSPERVMRDLHTLLDGRKTKKVVMTDNIMPHAYFQTLLPRLAHEFSGLRVFYETKANLSLPQVLALSRAGITSIQPGIESLSSRLLNLINKGVRARQNLMLLRYARAAGVNLDWLLLWGFPGDNVEAYEEMLDILPLLHHLQPPCAMAHLSIDRFSPYFSEPARFGVRKIKPLAGFYDFLPEGADITRIAYHFTAEYQSGAHDRMEVIQELWREIARWQAAWRQKNGRPNQELKLSRKEGSYVLIDTRDLWRKKRLFSLDECEASILVTSRSPSGCELEKWAVQEKLAVIADGWFVPLTVADPKVLLELTGERDDAPPPRNPDKYDVEKTPGRRKGNYACRHGARVRSRGVKSQLPSSLA